MWSPATLVLAAFHLILQQLAENRLQVQQFDLLVQVGFLRWGCNKVHLDRACLLVVVRPSSKQAEPFHCLAVGNLVFRDESNSLQVIWIGTNVHGRLF